MSCRIVYNEDIHPVSFNQCPENAQEKFREAFEKLEQSPLQPVKQTSFEFLSRVNGYNEYIIEVTTNETDYCALFEIEERGLLEDDKLKILAIGKESDIRI